MDALEKVLRTCGAYDSCSAGLCNCPGAALQKRQADAGESPLRYYQVLLELTGNSPWPYGAGKEAVESPGALLREAAATIEERGKDRDSELGERSMYAAVEAFNGLTGHELTETEGWKFMVCLKLARANHEKYNRDDYLDGAAYVALAGECHAEQGP